MPPKPQQSKWTPHPYLRIPSKEEAEALARQSSSKQEYANKLIEFFAEREHRISLEKKDPYYYGFELPSWERARELLATSDHLYIFGGNRSGKSEFMAKEVIRTMMEIPKARILCCHSSAPSSIKQQQPYVWKYIPEEFKNLPRQKVNNISFSEKNGFGGRVQTFILPNGSQCFFANYNQDLEDMQGDAYDLVWCDELVPLKWVRDLVFRLGDRNGKLVCSFTPIQGFTSTIREALKEVRVTKYAPAELLPPNKPGIPGGPPGQMPSEGVTDRGYAIWFATRDNPFTDYNRMKRELSGRSTSDIKIRCHGWVDNASTSQFPRFCQVHIVEPDQIPDHGTIWHSVDPAARRNWFMIWAKVTPGDNIYVYKEWPDFQTHGEWAIESDNADGSPGPAQTSGCGGGAESYKNLIRRVEGDAEVWERRIDPRAAKAPTNADEVGGILLIDELNDGDADNPGMGFVPAPGGQIENGVALINDRLDWNQELPLSGVNQPKLFISSACKNLIWALYNWTGIDRDKGACKDPVDALRYLVTSDPYYIDPEESPDTGETWGY